MLLQGEYWSTEVLGRSPSDEGLKMRSAVKPLASCAFRHVFWFFIASPEPFNSQSQGSCTTQQPAQMWKSYFSPYVHLFLFFPIRDLPCLLKLNPCQNITWETQETHGPKFTIRIIVTLLVWAVHQKNKMSFFLRCPLSGVYFRTWSKIYYL